MADCKTTTATSPELNRPLRTEAEAVADAAISRLWRESILVEGLGNVVYTISDGIDAEAQECLHGSLSWIAHELGETADRLRVTYMDVARAKDQEGGAS